jgi:hypothetical protein
MTSYILNFVFFAIGASIGIKFADIDLATPLRLRHRSAWTHGPLAAWLVIYLLSIHPNIYWLAVGFLPANAIHLFADMFPRNWKGGAMINFDPIRKTLAPVLSFAWLGIGAYYSAAQWLQITSHLWGWWPL